MNTRNMAERTLQESITNLNDRMNDLLQAIQPILAQVANPPETATFATTPGKSKVEQIIDYSTRYGAALYEEGSKGLYSEDDEDKFNLENAKAIPFMREVNARVKKMGWNDINQGITHFNVNGSTYDLIEDYGRIDIKEIQTQCEPFYLYIGTNSQERAAQNNAMMAEMLWNSLSKAAKDQVVVYKDEYELSDQGTPPETVVVAPALYKVIMRLTTLDSKTTNKALRDIILDLPSYAVSVNGDIDLIHTRFLEHYAQLKARGEDVNDKEGILFDTYDHVPDAEFREYIHTKKSDYYHNVNDMKGADWHDIMKEAKGQYDIMKQDAHHTWGSPSDAQEDFVAMAAQMKAQVEDEVKDELKDLIEHTDLLQALACQLNTKQDAVQSDTDSDSEEYETESESETDDSNDSENETNEITQTQNDAWKKVAPQSGEPYQKQHRNKMYNWCTHHQAWCIHKDSECRLGKTIKQFVSNQALTKPPYAELLAHLENING